MQVPSRAAKVAQLMGNRAPLMGNRAFLHLLGAFGASFCAEMVKNAQNFHACGGQGGLRRFLIGNGNYLLHATFAARVPRGLLALQK